MKCMYCGEPSAERLFCCDWHSALCVADLYDGEVRYGGKDKYIHCNEPMVKHKVLCSFCIHRLERVVVRRCSGVFRKIQDDTRTDS